MKDNLRIQDITARVSGINLKSTVRVLRALEISLNQAGEEELSRGLGRVLQESAWIDEEPCPLEGKPTGGSVTACDEVFEATVERQGWKRLRALQDLDGCPFYAAAAVDKEMSSND